MVYFDSVIGSVLQNLRYLAARVDDNSSISSSNISNEFVDRVIGSRTLTGSVGSRRSNKTRYITM